MANKQDSKINIGFDPLAWMKGEKKEADVENKEQKASAEPEKTKTEKNTKKDKSSAKPKTKGKAEISKTSSKVEHCLRSSKGLDGFFISSISISSSLDTYPKEKRRANRSICDSGRG